MDAGLLFSFEWLLPDIASKPLSPILLLLTQVPHPARHPIETRAGTRRFYLKVQT